MEIKHGCTSKSHPMHSLYRIWEALKRRCYNENVKDFHRYGGRGITVCQEWMDFIPFRDWALDNGYRRGLQIDRRDNHGNYEPSNCRFVPHIINSNNRRNNRLMTAFGETKTVADWSRDPRCKVNLKALYRRLEFHQFSPEKALTHPPHHNTKHRPYHFS